VFRETLRVLIADDHPVFRHGLCALLARVPDIDVIGEVASSGDEAVTAALSLRPDVVLVDFPALRGDAVRVTAEIRRGCREAGVLFLTMYQDDDLVLAALGAGARGYLLKAAGVTEIVRAIRIVHGGEAIFSRPVAERLIGYFGAVTARQSALAFPQLTDRERDVLSLMADGRTNPEIARQLSLSPKTIRNRISCIFTKLQVTSRAQAIVAAREAGLGSSRSTA
jgi:DNA-binding NarL/FixJ family response regulator